MPAYDYRCISCDHVFEVVLPHSRVAEAQCCPVCNEDAKRLFTPVGVVFKGSGFHNTDYRAKPTDSKQDPAPAQKESKPACGTSDACASCPASA